MSASQVDLCAAEVWRWNACRRVRSYISRLVRLNSLYFFTERSRSWRLTRTNDGTSSICEIGPLLLTPSLISRSSASLTISVTPPISAEVETPIIAKSVLQRRCWRDFMESCISSLSRIGAIVVMRKSDSNLEWKQMVPYCLDGFLFCPLSSVPRGVISVRTLGTSIHSWEEVKVRGLC